MPICIECRYPVSRLYHVLHSGNAGSRRAPPINRSTKPTQSKAAKQPVEPRPARSKSKGKAAPAVIGGDVRLTQCPRCKRFADKYVEHDYVVLFIDLVLVKPQLTSSSPIPHLPILLQYAFYLLLCALTTAAQHLTIRWLAGISGLGARIDKESEESEEAADEALARSSPNGISTALFDAKGAKDVLPEGDDAGDAIRNVTPKPMYRTVRN
ncbi:MAG: hypothetical protein Q9210_002251 [Variospora velana]